MPAFIKDTVNALEAKVRRANSDRKAPKAMNYTIPPPPPPRKDNIFSIIDNIKTTGKYMKGALFDGRDGIPVQDPNDEDKGYCKARDLRLGNRFFVKNGKCDTTMSVPSCRGKDRYMYIDNVPSSVLPCIDTTQPVDPLCSKMGEGLFTGVIEDILNVNPFEMIASSTGQGSIVNDTCVLRSELVGQEKFGYRTYTRETRCAPKRRPLICSMTMNGMPTCPLYDKTDHAEKARKADYQPKTPYLVEMTNKQLAAVIKRALNVTAEPSETERLPLDKYDTVWHTICQMVHEKWTSELKGADATPSFVLKHCCMSDKIQCANDILLYQWYATIYRTDREYGFQIKWRVYYNQNDQNSYMDKGDIVGNPMPTDLDTPTKMTAVGPNTIYEQIEGFTGGVATEEEATNITGNSMMTKVVRSRYAFALCILVRIALCVLAACVPLSVLPWLGALALIPAVGFVLIYALKLRRTGIETGGKPIWWDAFRPVHGALYGLFAVLALYRVRIAYVALVVDVIIGLLLFLFIRMRIPSSLEMD
jgi:hypothetical protein